MVSENKNKIPEGVGKRIIQTLQEYDFQADEDSELLEVPEEPQDSVGFEEESFEQQEYEPDEVYQETVPEQDQYEEEEDIVEEEVEYSSAEVMQDIPNYREIEEKSYAPKADKREHYYEQEQNNANSSDIDTLLNLISQLPSGVTKQTGAIIIRQTMEAMGISMNNLLTDAQSVQEDLENSIKDNVNVIEEYRNKIKILEKEIQKFRKKAHELEDIISLFILSDERKK